MSECVGTAYRLEETLTYKCNRCDRPDMCVMQMMSASVSNDSALPTLLVE